MKKSIFGKIGAAAVVLTLVTSSLVGGTFAKYVTNASGTAAGTVAKWGVVFKNGDKTFEDAASINIAGQSGAGTILPGDRGFFTVNIEGKEAEVGFDYSITLAADGQDVNALGDKLVFYSDDYTTKLENNTLTGEVAYDGTTPANMDKEIKVYWELPESAGANEDEINAADTLLAGKTVSYTVTMTATQKAGSSNPTTP